MQWLILKYMRTLLFCRGLAEWLIGYNTAHSLNPENPNDPSGSLLRQNPLCLMVSLNTYRNPRLTEF